LSHISRNIKSQFQNSEVTASVLHVFCIGCCRAWQCGMNSSSTRWANECWTFDCPLEIEFSILATHSHVWHSMTALLSLNHFPDLDLLCSNHLRVATSTSRLRPKALGSHKYLCMSLSNSQEFNRSFGNTWDCSMSYLKIFPLTHLHPLHSL